MNKKIISAARSMLVLIAIGAQLFKREAAQSANVSMNRDVQAIQISATPTAYEPNITIARANMPSVIQLNSQNNYGCTRELRIPAFNVQATLPNTGQEQIKLSAQAKGSVLDAVCSMGMYRFSIRFE